MQTESQWPYIFAQGSESSPASPPRAVDMAHIELARIGKFGGRTLSVERRPSACRISAYGCPTDRAGIGG